MKIRTFIPALLAASLAAVGGGFALVMPRLIVSGSPERSLAILRKQAALIQKAYAVIVRDQEQALDRLTRNPFPKTAQDQFALFKSLNLDGETEGVALYGSDKNIRLWFGRVVNLEPLLAGNPPPLTPSFRPKQILVRDPASSVLSLVVRLDSGAVLVIHRLLAFSPEFRSAYVDEYGFLSARLRRNATVDFWDFRENLLDYERLFSGNRDEFIGTPRLPEEAPSILLFPLRTAEGRITATVSLRPPSTAANRRAVRDMLAFFSLASLALALLLAMIAGLVEWRALRQRRPEAVIASMLGLIVFRAVFFPLARLEPASSSPLFSPDQAGFLSWADLTGSPMEIFLTALTLFGLAAGLTHLFAGRLKRPGFARAALLLPPFLLSACVWVIEKTAVHSNISLLRFEPSAPFLLLHASILLFSGAALWPALAIFRTAFEHRKGSAVPVAAYAAGSGLVLFLLGPADELSSAALALGLGLAAAWAAGIFPR
ncbi:MAG: hypothetical protein JW843_04345, partial [Candidatus Aminicenantes bacterium]|nr:hypothetical protein [Candidatus Aminicenantes bacterium]